MLPQQAYFGRSPNSTMIRRDHAGPSRGRDSPGRTIGRSAIDGGEFPLEQEAEGHGRRTAQLLPQLGSRITDLYFLDSRSERLSTVIRHHPHHLGLRSRVCPHASLAS